MGRPGPGGSACTAAPGHPSLSRTERSRVEPSPRTNPSQGPEPAGGCPRDAGAGRGPAREHVAPAIAMADSGPTGGVAVAVPTPRLGGVDDGGPGRH